MTSKDERLTWNELANLYDNITGKCARTQPMEKIFDWAEAQKDKFHVDKDGYIYKTDSGGKDGNA